MADPATYRPAPGSIPDAPGVYRFRDAHGRVIYVGKAKSLRVPAVVVLPGPRRPAPAHADHGHHRGLRGLDGGARPRSRRSSWSSPGSRSSTRSSTSSTATTRATRASRSRSTRTTPGCRSCAVPSARVCATTGPTPMPGRSARPSTCCCGSSRPAPARSGVFTRAGQVGRPCLLGYIGKCSAPCVGRVSAEEHRAIVDDFCAFMDGDTARYVRRLEREMKAASDEQEYERAARLRDDIGALTKAMERNAVVLGRRHRRRRLRAGGGPARGGRPGLPRPSRSGARAAWLRRRPRRGPRDR